MSLLTARHLANSPRLSCTVVRLACALLLFAQYVGVAHAIRHAWQPLSAHELRISNDVPARDAPKVSALCVFDAAFGQVLGAGPPAASFSSSQDTQFQCSAQERSAFICVERLTPLSRGPPTLV